jgi:hypothetical protein
MSAADPTPDVVAASYDGDRLVSLKWRLIDGVSRFVCGVLDADSRVVGTGTGFGITGTVRLTAPLTVGGYYYAVAAVDRGGDPVWGAKLLLVTQRLTALTVRYGGEREVGATWSIPPGTLANGATLVAVDTRTRTDLAQAVVFARSGTLTLPAPLDPTAPQGSYQLLASLTLAESVGPPVAVPLVAAGATLQGLEYDRDRPQIDALLGDPPSGGLLAGLALFAGARLAQEVTAATPGLTVHLRPASRLDPGVAWTVRPFWAVQGSQGPYGPATDVVVASPRIREVRWDGGRLVVAWENAPGPPYPTGAQVEVSSAGRVVCGFVSDDPTEARFVPAPPLQATAANVVTVAALRGVSQGPPSAPVPVVVGASPLTGVSYDGRVLHASWADSPPVAAQSARVRVRAGDLLVAESAGIDRAAAVEVALQPGGLYEASLAWVHAPAGTSVVSTGPEGAQTPLVSGAAQLATAVVDGGSVTLGWSDPPGSATVTALQAVFSSPGFAPRTATVTRAQPTVAIAAPSSDPLVPVTVAVQALNGAASGPLSGALPVLREAPVVTRAEFGDSAALNVAWTPVAGAVGSYLVTATRDGTAVATANVPADRTSAAVPLGSLVASSLYAVTVVARAGGARGPLPARATGAIVTVPQLGAASFDGTTLTASVTAPVGGGPAPDRYELELLRDGAVVQRATVAPPPVGSPLTLAVAPAIDRDGRFQLAVRAGAGAALGPAGTTAVLLAAPRVEQVGCDGRATVATVAPGAQPRDGLTLTATLSVDGVVSETRAVDGSGRATFSAPARGRVTVAAHGTRGGATGPSSESVTALTVAPVLASVRGDDGRVTVAWTPAGPVDVALLGAAGAVVASARVDGDHAVLEPPAGVAPPLTVSVAPRGERATGPAATATVLTAAPAIQQVATDPLTGAATVTFGTVTGPPIATGYDVQLLRDGAPYGDPVQTTTTTARLPPLGGLFDLSVAVRARGGGSGQPPLTGPYGTALPLLTGAPAGVTADFDGLTVRATWEPVTGATGYRVSVVAAGHDGPIAQVDAGAGEREARLAVRLPDTTSAWQVAVQPLLGASSGPPARAMLFTAGLYLRSDGQPRIFRATTLARQPEAVTAYLPEIGPLRTLPLPDAPTDAPLRIVANDDRGSSAVFPYRLSIAGAALDFSSGEAIRTAIWTASETLLTRAEDAGATPWGIVQLQQAISRLLPQTFAETLLYAYGLSPTTGTADLRPGMVLRVAAADFALMPSNRPPVWAQGYAGGATADYEVADYLDVTPLPADAPWLLGFDGYLSWLCANGALTVSAPQLDNLLQAGAADAADLYWPLFRQPFYRLFTPVDLQPSSPPAVAQTRQQFTLAAAATHRLISGSRPASSPGVAVAYFRGRAVVRLLIRVVVDGETQLVPIGTTVGNLLDRFARRPPRATTALRGLTLERSSGPVVLDPALYAAGGGMPVQLGFGGLATFDRRDALSLPLLHGDRLTLGEAGR